MLLKGKVRCFCAGAGAVLRCGGAAKGAVPVPLPGPCWVPFFGLPPKLITCTTYLLWTLLSTFRAATAYFGILLSGAGTGAV